MRTLITHVHLVNVRQTNDLLRGGALQHLPQIAQGYILIESDIIKDYGLMQDLSRDDLAFDKEIKGYDAWVLPAWCDSHTHLVFAKSRESEFIDKIRGLSYAEIAKKGGGILHSATALQQTAEDELYRLAKNRLEKLMQLGTGAIEIKSGYGLSVEAELKMLRVIKRLKESFAIPVKATFLGAHAIPQNYKQNKEAYIQLIINEMLPNIAREKLAEYIDVFCEQGFFDPQETARICLAGIKHGLKPKIHANQLTVSGGTEVGVRLKAVSVDHLETMDQQAIEALASSSTIGTLLPTAAFYLRMQYPPVRQMIEQNCALALATDYNPGSSPSGNMNFVLALACIQMRMLPEEAINAMTVNGAFAMELQETVGSISRGKKANLIFTKKIPSLSYLAYAFGENHIDRVMIDGKFI